MTEAVLSNELKQNIIRKAYYLYGKEPFLVEIYTDRILKKCLSESEYDFNLIKFSGNPDISALSESVDGLPVFAKKRVVILNDPEPEKADAASNQDLLELLGLIPPTTCVIINATGTEPDVKKAKTKKLISLVEKIGAVVEFGKMSESQTAELVIKRAARSGCAISQKNAAYLSRLCLCNLTLIGSETDKLCGYADFSGEITREMIELLTAKQLDAGVFALAAEITARRGGGAMKLLDELINLGNPPVMIMSALSSTFIDLYRAKLGALSGKGAGRISADFNYPKNRAWAVGKALTAVGRVPLDKIRRCVNVLCDADYRLKSSPVDDRVIMERAVAELLTLQ